MLDADVTGRAEIARIKLALGIVPTEMRKEIAKGTREALAPLKQEIPAAALRLPGGYGPLMSRAVKVATRVTAGRDVKATVHVTAKGKREERDVRRVNRGQLRHPLYGNRKHWYATTVRRGFVDDPVEDARKRVIRKSIDARDKVARMIMEA